MSAPKDMGDGWVLHPRSETACPHCEGSGVRRSDPVLVSPGGKRWDLVGGNPTGIAKAIIDANAQHRLHAEARKEVYGR